MQTRALIDSEKALNMGVLERILGLVEQESLFNPIAEQVRDPRIAPEKWRAIFKRELLGLSHWMMGPTSKRKTQPHPGQSRAHQRVLSLLPRNGVAVHFLRRAAPFAISGKPTSIHVHPANGTACDRVIECLAALLGIQEKIHFVSRQGAKAVSDFQAKEEDLLIVTGRQKTVRAIRSQVPCEVLGVTGRCSVVIANSPEKLDHLQQLFSASHGAESCTNLRASFLIGAGNEKWLAGKGPKSRTDGQRYDPEKVLSRLHPSVVLTSFEGLENQANRTCFGYSVVVCNKNGESADLTGFGMDPVEGWPGDFLI